jgi:hypothetical protein
MNELAKVINESGVEQATAQYLQTSFMPFFEKAKEWNDRAKTLVVTDVSQIREMKMAREARLALREIRVNADKVRKALKEDSIRYGRAVQGVYNVIEYLIVPTEKYLEDQEKFAEIQEAKRKAELSETRGMEVQPYIEFIPYGINLGEMDEPNYQKLLNGAKLQMQSKLEAEAKAEAERIAREKAEAEERERIRKENEKLKKEAEKREKIMAEERRKAEEDRKKAEEERRAIEERARIEREKIEAEKRKIEAKLRAKAEAEAKAKADAERKAKEEEKARSLAERKAKSAPDKEKLQLFANQLLAVECPELKTPEAESIKQNAMILIGKVNTYIISKINEL